MTGARLDARPPLRVARAVVLACLATAVGAGSHLLTGGAVGGTGVAAALPVLTLLAWPLTGRERGWWTITGVQLAGQHAAHALFALGASSHAATGLPADAWFYGHLLAAAVVATWLRHAERCTWAAARRAAAALSAHWRRLLTRLPDRPGSVATSVAVPAVAAHAAPRPLRHSVIRRGPPLPA